MKKIISLLLATLTLNQLVNAEYTDHRNHNVDSLETVMAGWTAKDLSEADDNTLKHVAGDLEELMYGFNQTNGVKSEYYARMLLGIAEQKRWYDKEQVAAKSIGQHFWAKEKFDSAAFYYTIAMEAVEAMCSAGQDALQATEYSQTEIDNGLSQMYGTLGNLYSMMDSVDVAMEYYEKAGELFKKHGWHNSSSVLYYNMGETMRYEENLEKAEEYYKESLNYATMAQDSLAIATAYKGLGSTYLDRHKTYKAMKYLNMANLYFADHEDEELQYRMESLDYTSQVLALQKKRLILMILLLIAVAAMATTTYAVSQKLKKAVDEKNELTEVLEDTVETLSTASVKQEVKLKPREQEVLDLIAKGYTNSDIAEAMGLSPETIKWYKKKLFATFDASNSAELIKIATDSGLI